MKNVLKLMTLVCFTLVAISCSKDDDPANNDLFVGTYSGSISYDDGETQKNVENGDVTVIKVGNDYNFRFSDGIPNLTGVEFEKDGDNTLVNVDFQDGVKYITIDESSLRILYTKDGKTWTANCDR